MIFDSCVWLCTTRSKLDLRFDGSRLLTSHVSFMAESRSGTDFGIQASRPGDRSGVTCCPNVSRKRTYKGGGAGSPTESSKCTTGNCTCCPTESNKHTTGSCTYRATESSERTTGSCTCWSSESSKRPASSGTYRPNEPSNGVTSRDTCSPSDSGETTPAGSTRG
jgi:hypothetical protein